MSVTTEANYQVQETIRLKQMLQEQHDGVRVILVRHGETDWNKQKRYQGWVDVPLNSRWRHQAVGVAELLKSIKIDYAFTSPLLRAKETATSILKYHSDISLSLVDNFKEIHHGDWQGILQSEIAAKYPEKFQQWYLKPSQVHRTGGETLELAWLRVMLGWHDMLELMSKARPNPKTVLVTAHDGTNKIILCHLCGLHMDSFWQFPQQNCSINLIDLPYGHKTSTVIRTFGASLREEALMAA